MTCEGNRRRFLSAAAVARRERLMSTCAMGHGAAKRDADRGWDEGTL